MKKIVLTLDGENQPETIEIDGKKVPIESFFLTTSVKNRDAGHFLAFGNSDSVGQMLFSFFTHCVKENLPEMAYTMEAVSRDIIDAVGSRGKEISESWEGEDEDLQQTH
jgi:hypothetical protein